VGLAGMGWWWGGMGGLHRDRQLKRWFVSLSIGVRVRGKTYADPLYRWRRAWLRPSFLLSRCGGGAWKSAARGV